MNWMSDEEYMELTGLNLDAIDDLCDHGKLDVKVEDGKRMIDSSKGINEVVPAQLKKLSAQNTQELVVQPQFIEKTIGTIINLHEKVLDAKDETIDTIKSENDFLKEALKSLQELYEDDRKTISTLREQLKISQQDTEFIRKKYKLMWNKAISEHTN